METLKKSIHGFFQLVLIKAHVRDGLRESTTCVVVRVGRPAPNGKR
jgi:hypothetical protein